MATVPATIEELKQQTGTELSAASVHTQIDEVATKRTKDQKPFLEILLRDWTAVFPLRVWSDHPSFGFCSELRTGDFVEVQGDFVVSAAFGLEAKNWSVRFLNAPEKADLLAGPPEVRERQSLDYAAIESFIASIRDPRLRELSLLFLGEFGERLRRAAGARCRRPAAGGCPAACACPR